jgi:hypothetical protein
MRNKQNYMLTWEEDDKPTLGEGLSRTSSKIAPFYKVDINFPGRSTMREWIRATSKSEALKFCTNKYPTATNINVVGRSNPTISAS